MQNSKADPSFLKLVKQLKFDDAVAERIKSELGLEQISYPNLWGDNDQYKKFVILSAPRCGSTFVGSLLQSHPQVVCYNELFKKDRCHFNYPFFPEEDDAELLKVREKSSDRFLEKFVFRGYREVFHAVGFKMLYPQWADPEFKAVKRWLMANHELQFIHLIRKNTLQVLISLKRATLSNEWWRMDPAFLDGLSRAGIISAKQGNQQRQMSEVRPFEIEPHEAQTFFERNELQYNQVKRELLGHEVLEIIYEDILEEENNSGSQMLDFLGVSQKSLKSRNIIQNTQSMSENIKNYEALKGFFEKTKWAHYFSE